MNVIKSYTNIPMGFYFMAFVFLFGCQEDQEINASNEATQDVIIYEESSSEQTTDSALIIEIPEDSILVAQIINSMDLDSFSRDAFCQTMRIKNRRLGPLGFVIETDAQSGAPCEEVQVSSFDVNANLVQVLPITLGCDCPSECEGCVSYRSVHWLDNTHFYIKKVSVIVLDSNDGASNLNEYDCDTKTIYKKSDGEIMPNGAIKISEEYNLHQKESILIDLQGKHPLSSISGFAGANAMYDYLKKGDTWFAEGSSIHQGRREAFDIDLGPPEYAILNGLQVFVKNDLSVEVLVGDSSILNIPFNPKGAMINLSGNTEDYVLRIPDSLNSSSTIINDELYIAVEDEVSHAKLSPIDLVIGNSDSYKLTYNLIENKFELTLFYADCCDNAIYIFKNQNNN